MIKIKPLYFGNHLYETAMGLYTNEEEAKEESWKQDSYFPLYSQEQVDELEAKLLKYESLYGEINDAN